MKRTPPPGAYIGNEEQFQRSAITAIRLVLSEAGVDPKAAMHIPNGGARDVVTGAKMKAAVAVAGYPDCMLFHSEDRTAYYLRKGIGDRKVGLAIELKIWPNKPRAHQTAIHELLRDAGWRVLVLYGLDEVINETRAYLGISK